MITILIIDQGNSSLKEFSYAVDGNYYLLFNPQNKR